MANEAKHLERNLKRWSSWAPEYDGEKRLYRMLREAQRYVVSFIEMKKDLRFLDVGCGTGYAIGQMADRLNGEGEFYGVDLTPGMIERAKKNFQNRENIRFVIASAESIPLESGFFDSIICTNSFHHYLHPENALKEFYRLLKHGGKVYILDPSADMPLARMFDRLIALFQPDHVRVYRTEEFRTMFEQAGFVYRCSQTRPGSHGIDKLHIAEKGSR